MKSSTLLSLVALLSVALLQGDPLTKLEITTASIPIILTLDTGGISGNLIEISSDFLSWRPYLNVSSRVPSFRLADLATVGAAFDHRFYRARIGDAQSPLEMRRLWVSAGLTNYQFRFTRTCFCMPITLSGTVTVKSGKVVAVSDASGSNGPIQDSDLSQFKSIEDLFDLVQRDQYNADVFAVAFDETLSFPELIEIDYNAQTADDEISYQASDVQAFDSAATARAE